MYSRRHLLGAVTIAAVSAAGCTSAVGDGGDTADPNTPGVRLADLTIQNAHDGAHHVQLAVESDSEMLHLGTYELDGGESRTIDGEWSESSGSYRIHTALDGGDVQSANVTDGISDGADCARVLIRIDDEGELAVWNGSNCGPGVDDSELESA